MAQHYDVAVIGSGPSGIIAAALLAKRGRRVLLVDHGEDVVTYKRRGLRLPLVPTLVPSLDASPPMQKVHEELGVMPELRANVKQPATSFQAVMPKRRFVIAADLVALQKELALEFPDLAGPMRDFFTQLFAIDDEIGAFLGTTLPIAPKTIMERWNARGWQKRAAHLAAPFDDQSFLQAIPKTHPLRDVLLSPLNFFGHLLPEKPTTFAAVRLLARYFRGTSEFPDRLGGLSTFWLRTAKAAGVDVRRGAEVKNIELAGKSLKQLELVSERLPYSADFFIANTFGPFHELLPAKAGVDSADVRAIGSLLVMNFVVHKDVIPCGMAENVFLLNGRLAPREDEPADPPVLLQRLPAHKGEGGKLDDELVVLSAACPVRTAEVVHSPERFRVLKSQMIERVARVVPFLRDHLRDTSLPSDTQSWDVDKEGAARRVDPWTLHPLYESAEPPVLGVAARSPRTAFKNLWYCGRDVMPGLGIEGDYVAGLAAAEGIAALAGKKWQTPR